MPRFLSFILLSALSLDARANDMPFLEYVQGVFPEVEPAMSEYFDLFETEQYIYALRFGSDRTLTVMMKNGGPVFIYPGKHSKKYLDFRKSIVQFHRVDVYREDDRTSIMVSTAGKFGAFIEARLNRYYETPEPRSCEEADFSEEGYCLVRLQDNWFVTYPWFPR